MSARAPKPPVRLQLTRKAGFDLQKASLKANGLECVKVHRSTPWGNHYAVIKDAGCWRVLRAGERVDGAPQFGTPEKAAAYAVALHAAECEPKAARIRAALAGVNLACWCEIGASCHGDTLLKIANTDG